MILHTASRLYRHAFSSIWFNRRVLILWHGKRERERQEDTNRLSNNRSNNWQNRSHVRSLVRSLAHSFARTHQVFSSRRPSQKIKRAQNQLLL